jgi:hypothetical protein
MFEKKEFEERVGKPVEKIFAWKIENIPEWDITDPREVMDMKDELLDPESMLAKKTRDLHESVTEYLNEFKEKISKGPGLIYPVRGIYLKDIINHLLKTLLTRTLWKHLKEKAYGEDKMLIESELEREIEHTDVAIGKFLEIADRLRKIRSEEQAMAEIENFRDLFKEAGIILSR